MKADRAVHVQLAAAPPNEDRMLLATGRYVGDGIPTRGEVTLTPEHAVYVARAGLFP